MLDTPLACTGIRSLRDPTTLRGSSRCPRALDTPLAGQLAVPAGARYPTRLRGHPLAARSAISSASRIERVAQAVAEQVEGKHQQKDRQPGPDRHPGRVV